MRSVGRSAPLHPLGDGMREGSHPLALSRGCSVEGFGFRRDRRAANFSLRHFCFCGGLHENFVPDRTGARRVALIGAFASAAVLAGISFPTAQDVGRSAPLLPLGERGARGFTPSRALPGLFGRRVRSPAEQAGGAFETAAHVLPRLFDRRFRSPTKPRGCSDRNFVSDDAGVGRSAPLHPLGDGVREGCDPLALSRGLFERCFGFRENARGVPLGTEAGESHIFTSRFRRSFSLQRNAFTALFRRTGCKRCLHPAAPKNGEFMKLID